MWPDPQHQSHCCICKAKLKKVEQTHTQRKDGGTIRLLNAKVKQQKMCGQTKQAKKITKINKTHGEQAKGGLTHVMCAVGDGGGVTTIDTSSQVVQRSNKVMYP